MLLLSRWRRLLLFPVYGRNSPHFETIPMKFGDGEQEISDFWREYYRELGLPVPLNQPGTNPSQLAASPLLKVKKGIFMIQILIHLV